MNRLVYSPISDVTSQPTRLEFLADELAARLQIPMRGLSIWADTSNNYHLEKVGMSEDELVIGFQRHPSSTTQKNVQKMVAQNEQLGLVGFNLLYSDRAPSSEVFSLSFGLKDSDLSNRTMDCITATVYNADSQTVSLVGPWVKGDDLIPQALEGVRGKRYLSLPNTAYGDDGKVRRTFEFSGSSVNNKGRPSGKDEDTQNLCAFVRRLCDLRLD